MAENTNPNPNPNPNPEPNSEPTPEPNPAPTPAPAPAPAPTPNPPAEAVVVAIPPPEEPSKPQEVITETKTMPPNKLMIKVKTYSGLLSIITTILSFLILVLVIWLFYMRDYDCEKLLGLQKLQIELGVVLLFLFLFSIAAVYFKTKFPFISFTVIMVFLLVILIMSLALVGANKMGSSRIQASPMWIRQKLRDPNNWRNIKSCIYSTGECDELAARSFAVKAYDFSLKKLSSLESGCCNPPKACEMEYVNATYWTAGSGNDGVAEKYEVTEMDCERWNNSRTVLCYDCDSCKEGFVKVLESEWWNLGLLILLLALLLIICHLLLFVAEMWQRRSPGIAA